MQTITFNWYRLLRYALLFLAFSLLMTLGMLLWFSNSLTEVWQKGRMLSMNDLGVSIELTLTLLIYISFPVLLFRFMFYFAKMIYRGRNPGIGIFCYQTLFNPLNFMLFPSLLNTDGLRFRRRCLTSIVLLLCLYCAILLITL
ncbi:hypothetical protein LZP73_09150 [Shewanella sp. AS16]|uniref:hypothetical protein n=1 Tax=Shewanella sp. AS16 TaxID=2907625 RepID=UPI001F2A9C54|nr:hypothetical protein [Shewanella sp. AS16]MCE9686378.1 hypothetical protein [Shewanella sp. AS16]